MNKLYNTQKNLARDLAKFFQKTTIITKPQLKIIPYIILGMIEAESVVTNDIVKKLKGDFSLVNPFSTVRRLERFFNNPKFDVYKFYQEIISNILFSTLRGFLTASLRLMTISPVWPLMLTGSHAHTDAS